MKKYLRYYLYFLLLPGLIISIYGCKKTEDLIRVPDPTAIDANVIWEDENSVQFFLNDAYQFLMPVFPYEYTANNYGIHLISDENYFSGNDTWGKKVWNLNGVLISNDCRFAGVKYQSSTYGDNRYWDVARCNVAIKRLPLSNGISAESKKRLLGQFYALRGIMYLGLAKIYGGMPLVLEPQNPAKLELGGRVKAKVMFDQIVKDFDSAASNLNGVVYADPGNADRGKINKAAALALKAKALLWWASPLFNPQGHPSYDITRWKKAFDAAEEAYNFCVSSGYKLMTNYGSIFQTEGLANTEAILVRSYSATQFKRFHGVESRVRPSSEGGSPNDVYNPSQQMINAYLMKDGMPITASSSDYRYSDTLFWFNRDPRFDATIAFNGSPWALSGKSTRKQWAYAGALVDGAAESSKAFYVKRFSTPSLARASVASANDIGGSGMDWIEIRLAEVMLDYAEAANELEVPNTAIAKNMVRLIRQRAGIVAGSADYGLSLATDKGQMRDLIMNERMVEFAFEGKRPEDLRRTRRMHTLTGTIAQMAPLQLNSAALKTELETPIGTNTAGIDPTWLRRDTLNINNRFSIQKYFKYPYTWTIPASNGSFSMPQSYYFFGLSDMFINSSALLEQTIGWTGGTFDPL